MCLELISEETKVLLKDCHYVLQSATPVSFHTSMQIKQECITSNSSSWIFMILNACLSKNHKLFQPMTSSTSLCLSKIKSHYHEKVNYAFEALKPI